MAQHTGFKKALIMSIGSWVKERAYGFAARVCLHLWPACTYAANILEAGAGKSHIAYVFLRAGFHG